MKRKKYSYDWRMADQVFSKHKGSVFSCFSGGGGSSLGYLLSGYDVIGANEIDPKMLQTYHLNIQSTYTYNEPIQRMVERREFPKPLYNLDILDGSPPCSSFTLGGTRESDWGKEKYFKEGQVKQVLDTLFFDFIALAKKLQPKVVVAENVKGILLGSAQQYVKKIHSDLKEAGYITQHFLFDSSTMGVPQKRERVFFVALRNDLATPFLKKHGFFEMVPEFVLPRTEQQIPYKQFEDTEATEGCVYIPPLVYKYWPKVSPGQSFARVHEKKMLPSYYKIDRNRVLATIDAMTNGSGPYNQDVCRNLTLKELCNAGTFPTDYNFGDLHPKYVVGMSVPPLMIAKIADAVYSQWLRKIK
jgi:DNA (cytosine-5)-methyltransferase 1